jgi:hypothetical protein
LRNLDVLTESSSHWADDDQINILSYWEFFLQIFGKLITLWTEAEIGERRVVKVVVLCFRSTHVSEFEKLGNL